MVNKDEIDGDGNEVKILSISFTSKKSTKADYLSFNAKKTFNYLR